MAKTCPSCGYQPIGPFIDNCPICAEPVRNVRSDPVGSAGPMNLWVRWLLGALLAMALSVAGCCGLGMWRMGSAIEEAQKAMLQARAAAEADRKARTLVVSAADLLHDFHKDAAEADRKYQNKILECTGIVERKGKGGAGASFVILHAGDEQAALKIECFFDFLDEEEGRNQRLDHGRTVTLRGDYAGRVSHVQLRSCMLAE